MPSMTEKMLVRQVMSLRPTFPGCLFSGFHYMMHEGHAEEMGLQAYLTNPVPMGGMARAIQAAIPPKVFHTIT